MRRVVVTGLGAVTPLGNDVENTWAGLVAGRSGISRLEQPYLQDLAIRTGGQIKGLDPRAWIGQKELRFMNETIQYGVIAAMQALRDSKLDLGSLAPEDVGAIMPNGFGGTEDAVQMGRTLLERGPDRVSPLFLTRMFCSTASALLSIILKLEGPNVAIMSACASGAHAIGEAAEIIKRGDAVAMLAGGSEGCLHTLPMSAFIKLGLLGGTNEEPEKASRPFDARRDGFVLAEGAGALLLEELEHAQARGARIYAELIGYGTGSDAYHVVAPREGGVGAAKCMQMALRKAGLRPSQIDYVNAHGTSTKLNDLTETQAIKRVFGEGAYRVPISSNKSMLGHSMGASGAVEAVMTVKTLVEGVIPPTINYEYPDPECDLDYVPNVARKADVNVALSNSFGFGGHNASLIFRRWGAAA